MGFIVLLFIGMISFCVANGDDQAASDAESAAQQAASDASSAQQQAESDSQSDGDLVEEVIEEIEEETIEEVKKDDTTEEVVKYIDEFGNEIERKTKIEIKDGELITEYEEKIIGSDGSETIIKTKTEIKEGQEEITYEKKFTGSDGKEVIIKTKTELEGTEEEVSNLIEVKGAQVDTKLAIKAESKESETILVATLSTGVDQEIIVLPDAALEIALDELKTSENLDIQIKEVSDQDDLKAVFEAKANQQGKILGIFDVNLELETLIDTQTGEVIKTERPWFAFLVIGANEATICHVLDEKSVVTQTVLIKEVKTYLTQGDSLGECVAVCGDGIIVENVETCEGDTKECLLEGYSGAETCNSDCTGYDSCVTTEFCGDEIVNGEEECDDGNQLDEDGCSGVCLIEVEPSI